MAYDPACEVLSRVFLGTLASNKMVAELSQHVQDEVESFLEQAAGEAQAALVAISQAKAEGLL